MKTPSSSNSRIILASGFVLMALAVAIGAFGAHGLKNLLEANGRLDTFQTATEYHVYHALGLIFFGIISRFWPKQSWVLPSVLFGGGIVLFSGSLYVLCITGVTWLGAITPLGGISFIAGWLLAAKNVLSHEEKGKVKITKRLVKIPKD